MPARARVSVCSTLARLEGACPSPGSDTRKRGRSPASAPARASGGSGGLERTRSRTSSGSAGRCARYRRRTSERHRARIRRTISSVIPRAIGNATSRRSLPKRPRTRRAAWPRERRPTPEDLLAAHGKSVPDVIAPGLRVLFCGINPGLYTAAVGHHFARPGNRFWPALHKSGFTDRLLSPFAERELLKSRIGISNVVSHATAAAAELTKEDFITGGRALAAKVEKYRPRIVAILGVGAYRLAFGATRVLVGRQEQRIGDTEVWALPNPSGRTAGYQLEALVLAFRALRRAADRARAEFLA